VVARVDPKRPPRKGETVRLMPAADEVYVFDVETGEHLGSSPAS
jgi:hypothetical protein